MNLFCRVMQIQDLQEIFDFEAKKLESTIADETERAIYSWNARWRQESLEHYLPIGWSFLIRDQKLPSSVSSEGLLQGYFIAQPFLFVDGQTQSLWIEHISYSTEEARDQLCELAYKLAREKHLQKVYFPQTTEIMHSTKIMRAEPWTPAVLSVKTTKV